MHIIERFVLICFPIYELPFKAITSAYVFKLASYRGRKSVKALYIHVQAHYARKNNASRFCGYFACYSCKTKIGEYKNTVQDRIEMGFYILMLHFTKRMATGFSGKGQKFLCMNEWLHSIMSEQGFHLLYDPHSE